MVGFFVSRVLQCFEGVLLLSHRETPTTQKELDMTTYNVVINDDTTGTIDESTLDGQHADNFLGEMMTIHAHDENGNSVEHYGRLTEVLS